MNANIVIPSASRKYEYKQPRSFKLHDELTTGEKGTYPIAAGRAANPHASQFSIGSAYNVNEPMSFESYDLLLNDWNVTMFTGPQGTAYFDRTYNIKVRAGAQYPDQPPLIWFNTKISCPGIDATTGAVSHSSIGLKWNRDCHIMDALCAVRQHMTTVTKGIKQPGANETFPLPQGFPRT